MSVKNLLKTYIHSDILSTSLDTEHKPVGVLGVTDAAKVLEFISYFWSLRLGLLLHVVFIKLSGHRTRGTQKVLKTVDSYKAGIYFVLFSCSAVPDSFVTPWTVASQDPLSMGFPSFGKVFLGFPWFLLQGIFPTQKGMEFTSLFVSCIGKLVLYHCTILEAQTFTASMQVSSVRKTNMFYLQWHLLVNSVLLKNIWWTSYVCLPVLLYWQYSHRGASISSSYLHVICISDLPKSTFSFSSLPPHPYST